MKLFQFAQTLWRYGQPPDVSYWRRFAEMGIKSVVKLNFEIEGRDSDARDLALDVHYLGLDYGHPSDERIKTALLILEGASNALVHCGDGAGRTGLVVGLYRRRVCGWPKAKAWDEMIEFGFDPRNEGLVKYWESWKD